MLADGRTNLMRIDPEGNQVVSELRLPAGCSAVLSAESAVWIACPQQGKVLRLDPKTEVITNRIETAAGPVALASGAGSIWVLCKNRARFRESIRRRTRSRRRSKRVCQTRKVVWSSEKVRCGRACLDSR
ncbi:MAG: hypothetical protein QM757_01055 [Paludibaculum sp.]